MTASHLLRDGRVAEITLFDSIEHDVDPREHEAVLTGIRQAGYTVGEGDTVADEQHLETRYPVYAPE